MSNYITIVKRKEATWAKLLQADLSGHMHAAATVLLNKGAEAVKNELDKIAAIDPLIATLNRLYTDIGLWSARRTTMMINRSAKEETKAGFGMDEQWIKQIQEFFRLYLLTKAVVPITDETKNQILAILSKGEQEGLSIDEMAKLLESPELIKWRARMIARTEIAKAHFYGQELAKKDSQYQTRATWIAANDHRTRHSHRAVDGHQAEEGEKFKVPIFKSNAIIGYDYMKGPGDPEASAGNVINCRCTTEVRAVRDENGRIVRKNVGNSRISVILPNQRSNITQVVTI